MNEQPDKAGKCELAPQDNVHKKDEIQKKECVESSRGRVHSKPPKPIKSLHEESKEERRLIGTSLERREDEIDDLQRPPQCSLVRGCAYMKMAPLAKSAKFETGRVMSQLVKLP